MPSSIKDYRELIQKPWGRMFYEMIFRQLNLSDGKPLKILDFGAGFCVTASHYAQNHNVTAVEPDKNMLRFRIDAEYQLINGCDDVLNSFDSSAFDLVICHNVLEYVQNKEFILKQLSRVLKSGGKLSIVKHNLTGRILANAVFADDPKTALELLENGDNQKNMFGSRNTYSNEYLTNFLNSCGLMLSDCFGIRTFFGLSSNDDIKFTDEWYENMLKLEMKACNADQYKSIAFFNHLIFTKL